MIITVGTGKGGTGKTTTAVGLAATWADKGHDVLLVDLDPQDAGSATWWLKQANPKTFNWTKATSKQLAHAINDIPAEIIIIDTPPRLDETDLPTATKLADHTVFVSEPSALAVAATAQTIATTMTTNTYSICLTKIDPRSIPEANKGRQQLIELGHPTPTIIRHYAAIRRAAPKQIPTDLPGLEGQHHRYDLQALTHYIEQQTGANQWQD